MNLKVIYMLTTVFYPSIGGRESHIHNISKELVKMGYIVKIIFPVINCSMPRVYELDGIEVHQIKIGDNKSEQNYQKYKKKSKGILGYLSGYLRKYYYNHFYKEIFDYIEHDRETYHYAKQEILIHQHEFISGFKLSKACARQYPIIFTNHTGEFLFLKKLPLSDIPIRYLTKHFDYAISPSKELNGFEGIRDKSTYAYIPNGVDVDKFYPVDEQEKNLLRSKRGIPQDKVVLLCPRRWAPTKGIIYLIEAINKLGEHLEKEDFIVAFAGNDYEDYPEYREEINAFIEKNHLEKHILRLGNLPYEAMNDITKLSDVVVIPSLMEAVSLSMLESMACGKIVVGSDTGGIPEVIKEGQNGFLVPKGDSDALASKLDQVITHIQSMEDIQKAAVDLVKQKYTWEAITKQVEEIYKEVWRKRYE